MVRGKESSFNAGDMRDMALIPGSEQSSREGNENPLHYSCLKNIMDRGAWWATVWRVAKSPRFITLYLAIIYWIWYQKHRQEKQK